MYCQNCGAPCAPNARFCASCGSALIPTPVQTAPRPAYPPYPVQPVWGSVPNIQPPAPVPMPALPEQKGSHRVPILILVAMSVIGLILYFLTAGNAPAQAASETPWFRNENGTLYFEASRYDGGDTLTVPETVDGGTVLYLSEDCFADCYFLATVILPDSLEEIGAGAFDGCSGMRGIFIPEQVTYIGTEAFRDCVSLEAITIPASVQTLGADAFEDCGKLDFIFYADSFDHWQSLCKEEIDSDPMIYCEDGSHPHAPAEP